MSQLKLKSLKVQITRKKLKYKILNNKQTIITFPDVPLIQLANEPLNDNTIHYTETTKLCLIEPVSNFPRTPTSPVLTMSTRALSKR